MTGDQWNPDQYARFRDERSQPFFDLLGLVRPEAGMRVADLGCGTGELTRVLHEQLAARETVGIDSSAAMLERAGGVVAAGLSFERGDVEELSGEAQFDLLFSNAALQWVPHHAALLERLTRLLTPGGQLAVQVPANGDHPSHLVANEVAGEEPFRSALGGYVRRWPVLGPEDYAALLERLGYREQHVRVQIYPHRLPSREAVVEWTKGTFLTDYQRRMPAALFDRYLARYRETLMPRLDGATPFFYPFKRVLFWARR